MMAPELPILYSFRRCPYAMRARLAIAASGQACELREIILRDKPAEMLLASPKGTVPVLVDVDGCVIEQSLDIMRWALSRHDPEQWLIPERGSVDEMVALIIENDGPFKQHLDRYKYPDRYASVNAPEQRDAGADWLRSLDAMLASHGYLFGTRPCLADMAIAPFVRQFAATDRDWFDTQPWPALASWLDRIVSSARFEHILQKFPRWTSGTTGARFP